MSVRPSASTPHHTQALPSFAQAFSNSSLDRLSAHDNALPPIQPHPTSLQRSVSQGTPPPGELSMRPGSENGASRHNGKKRSHPDTASNIRDEVSGSPRRQRVVLVKEEQDELADDDDPPTRQARPQPSGASDEVTNATISSNVQPPAPKKRRVTISGQAHPLDTRVSPNSSDPNAAPMSPVVMGFTMRDDPAAIEQMRSVLTIKQNQKALIEQRRGSLGGLAAPSGQTAQGATHTSGIANPPNAPRQPASSSRPGVRSPNMSGTRIRASISGPELPPPPRTSSPNAPGASNQHPSAAGHAPGHPDASQAQVSGGPLPNALPPPPISFARRRAGGGGKKKPADIVISPRDPSTNTRLQPAIQSAPPVPHGQAAGRFPMVIPSLPPVLGQGPAVRRAVPGNVPPTPTRLSMRGAIAAQAGSSTGAGGTGNVAVGGTTSGHSPPASVPIASALVPPTPATLQHPGYSSDKASFLAPFEVFYDALRDAKELKTWLADQLQKSQGLQQSLQQQQERLEQVVEAAVERRVGAMREEMFGLRRRVDELEDALHAARGESLSQVRRRSLAMDAPTSKGRPSSFGGPSPTPAHSNVVPETYTFPPVEPPLRPEAGRSGVSPTQRERELDNRANGESENNSPAPYDTHHRLSVSAIRMDPPPPPSHAPESSASGTRVPVSQPSASKAKGMGSPRHTNRSSERPQLLRRQSGQRGEEGDQGPKRPASRSISRERKRDPSYTRSPSSRPHTPMDDREG
ncbi:hypothetical protein DENSPDRAFT_870525 [Dentipellis sp. KUC8613]|nr:hypothetical protein DENSPDRAFT_870525 [Dentipellis sp. KUC8613]